MNLINQNRELLEELINGTLSPKGLEILRNRFTPDALESLIQGNALMRQTIIDATREHLKTLEEVAKVEAITAKVLAESQRRQSQRTLAKRILILGLSVFAIALVGLMIAAPEWINSLSGSGRIELLPLAAAGMIGFALIIAVLLEWRS